MSNRTLILVLTAGLTAACGEVPDGQSADTKRSANATLPSDDQTAAEIIRADVDEKASVKPPTQVTAATTDPALPALPAMPAAEEMKQHAPMSPQRMESAALGAVLSQYASNSLTGVDVTPPREPWRENYAQIDEDPVKRVTEAPVSTFSIDVDTGAYSNARRFLNQGQLPPQDAIRVEELINYFAYDYAPPADRNQPFAAHTEILPTPWNPKTRLLRVGIKAFDTPKALLPPANLVFLIDVSGSMDDPAKLPLLQSSLKLMLPSLDANDRIGIVVYAGDSGVVLEPTPGDQRQKIEAAIDALVAGGSTNGEAGIQEAYALARQSLVEGGINRIILATDGDFNVGVADVEYLKDLVERERRSGVGLTTLGFGTGNYNDAMMEQLADAGDGAYAYIDNLTEARKVLVDQLSSTLETVAKDVKIQVEFNPASVAEYRLIGYENRSLNREDFSNDMVDAGEIGAGHSVTALYELALTGEGGERIEAERYADTPALGSNKDELAFLRIRYKQPTETASQLIETPILISDARANVAEATADSRFAAAVAAFGQLLRGGKYTENFNYEDVLALANGARGEDPFGYRTEFANLVRLAQSLDSTTDAARPDLSALELQ